MKTAAAIISEARTAIGSGHLIESFNIAAALLKQGINVRLWVNKGAPEGILLKSPCPCLLYDNLKDACGFEDARTEDKAGVILFDFRKITTREITLFKQAGRRIVCIDELGLRRLGADAIINPLIVKRYQRYPRGAASRIYLGSAYLAMSPVFSRAHEVTRRFPSGIRSVTVCMGGVDRSGATFNIIDCLAGYDLNVRKNIILGGGFLRRQEAVRKLRGLSGRNFRLYYNLSDLAEFFKESDVVFTAGGNILYELACVGTPAIVLYEDEHERENGVAFQKKGFGVCLGAGVNTPHKEILSALAKFEKGDLRRQHARCGRKIVDGRGSERIAQIIMDYLK